MSIWFRCRPITESIEDELKELYADIKQAQKHMKNKDINILMGDGNSKVGAGKVDRIISHMDWGNHRGTGVVKLCQENMLIITNTWFKLPKRQIYTWRSSKDIYKITS